MFEDLEPPRNPRYRASADNRGPILIGLAIILLLGVIAGIMVWREASSIREEDDAVRFHQVKREIVLLENGIAPAGEPTADRKQKLKNLYSEMSEILKRHPLWREREP